MALCSRKSRSGWPCRTFEGLALPNRARQRLLQSQRFQLRLLRWQAERLPYNTPIFPQSVSRALRNNELRADKNILKSPTFSRSVHEHFTWPNDSQFRRATVDG